VKSEPPSRPGDILRPPKLEVVRSTKSVSLPPSWKTIMDTAESWPYVDPDTAMGEPDSDFTDYAPILYEEKDDLIYSPEEPWGKMKGETGREYAWFSYYRSLGIRRRKRDVAKKFEVASASVSGCVQKNDWDERIIAWDNYREEEYTKEVIQGVREMAQTHATIARNGIEALGIAFEVLQNRIATGEEALVAELADMPVKALFSIVQKSAQVIPNLMNAERLSRGMPTEIQTQFSRSETTIKIQTSEELTEIVNALAGVLGSGESSDEDQFNDGWGEGEIIEIIDPENE